MMILNDDRCVVCGGYAGEGRHICPDCASGASGASAERREKTMKAAYPKEVNLLVIIKNPGEDPYITHIPNTLESFQAVVGGYIETVTLFKDVVFICNEEGRLKNLQPNVSVGGYDFVGPIVAVGVKGPEFASVKSANVPLLMHLLAEPKKEPVGEMKGKESVK